METELVTASAFDSGSPKIASGVFQPCSLGSSLPKNQPHMPIGMQMTAGTINMPMTDPLNSVFAPQRARTPATIAPTLCEAFHQPMKRPRRARGVHRFIVELQQGPPGAWKRPLSDHRRIIQPYGLWNHASTRPMRIDVTPEASNSAEMTFLVFLPSMKNPRMSPPKP